MVVTQRNLLWTKQPRRREIEEQEVHKPMEIDNVGPLIRKYHGPIPNPTNFLKPPLMTLKKTAPQLSNLCMVWRKIFLWVI